MLKIKTMSVYSEGNVWRKANFAGIGKTVTAKLLFCPQEKLFEVRVNNILEHKL